MADYTIAAGHNGVEPWTMTANQVDTVTFADNVTRIQIISDGAAEVRITNGGSTPTIGADGSSTIAYRLPAGVVSQQDIAMPKSADLLKLIASGTARVSVQISQ